MPEVRSGRTQPTPAAAAEPLPGGTGLPCSWPRRAAPAEGGTQRAWGTPFADGAPRCDGGLRVNPWHRSAPSRAAAGRASSVGGLGSSRTASRLLDRPRVGRASELPPALEWLILTVGHERLRVTTERTRGAASSSSPVAVIVSGALPRPAWVPELYTSIARCRVVGRRPDGPPFREQVQDVEGCTLALSRGRSRHNLDGDPLPCTR